ncbi:2-dehydro-3-deoxygalactonokinase [Paraburkholderia saeva]|uniref:2-dehydro-3-deoxygalactonokinase DgoK1 n=1 Tax=Paraburkholderia saeva TaxID=2777537 RepID=A0A9N8RSD9_9BURK|nr:2-dehydro-3-deoxygalactonokinase [Paraburkholderia saeva]CAG4885826.1 putative 2-dehydro-3-deoxygalactonokinase DgoK1 [Paraburkholderia saeva]CAG4887674.1 putative 2-dehydro-3-deoxygalactonokinase DgoK1 [Paraburkholderia saeva]CAG4916023.1 putative 2-dehydro-3-deoxygalactonokinase DgoK1 [Paraburkholderia saeva]
MSQPSTSGASASQARAALATDAIAMNDAALIALDWGTTSLRAYLFDAAGNVLDARASSAGIMNLPRPAAEGGFDAAFDAACGTWLDARPDLPVVAAGMVGSAQGWVEAPYVDAPADADSLVAGIVRVKTARGNTLHIVPGVLQRGDLPNVMRGEETQIFGALAGKAADAAGELIGLPGTHAKWAVVRNGRIERFHTFMTGEVFGALRDHTILGRTMTAPAAPDTEAFLRGVSVARDSGTAGVLATIFSTRTLGLTGQLAANEQPDYLSGLLIGHELAGLEAVFVQQQSSLAGKSLLLIGNDALCERYRLALAQFGCTQAALVQHATEHGLWRIATQAGFIASAETKVSASATSRTAS